MSCPFVGRCPACCRMFAYDEELESGLCHNGRHDRCARHVAYAQGIDVAVGLLPNGLQLPAPPEDRGAMVLHRIQTGEQPTWTREPSSGARLSVLAIDDAGEVSVSKLVTSSLRQLADTGTRR